MYTVLAEVKLSDVNADDAAAPLLAPPLAAIEPGNAGVVLAFSATLVRIVV